MNRRRACLAALSFVLLVVVAGIALAPPVWWRLLGHARGEAFYQGRPTSFWQLEIQNRYEERERFLHFGDKCAHVIVVWERQSSAFEDWLDKRMSRTPAADGSGSLLNPDEDAIPVLLELFGSDDIKVRRFAAFKLSRFGPYLWEAAESEDESVRRAAIAAWKPDGPKEADAP